MAINENNSHINSFVKGMNSDTVYDQIQNSQYTFGKNIRITKNQFLGGVNDFSTVHEGMVTPVPAGTPIDVKSYVNVYGTDQEILAVDSIEDYYIIISSSSNALIVYRGKIEDDQLTEFKRIYRFDNFWTNDSHQVSAFLYKELENVIKLYIASGEYPIITLRIDDLGLTKWEGNSVLDVDSFINNRITPKNRVYIQEVISGRLLASQVQYTYRLYNKHGNTTQLAPLTNKIQVIDSSRDKETGNAESTETAKGFQLKIDIKEYRSVFDRIQVYRLTYIKPQENAEVSLIYDDNIKQDNFVLNDVGIEPLQTLTIEEFAAMSGLILVPQVIQNNQNYMFCANIKDDTIIKELADPDSPGSYIRPVITEVTLSNKCTGEIPNIPTDKFSDQAYIKLFGNGADVQTVNDYFEARGVSKDLPLNTYNNQFTSSLLRSLRRGETYKYGIVYYDKYGRRSDVKSLGTVTIPGINTNYLLESEVYVPKDSSFEDSDNTETVEYTKTYENSTNDSPVHKVTVYGTDWDDDTVNKMRIPFKVTGEGNEKTLVAQPIGIQIQLPQPKDVQGNIIPDIIGCQIVRRSSSDIYQNTLLQVALARPVQQGLMTVNGDFDSEKKSPFYPSGFLTTNETTITPPYYPDITALSSTGSFYDGTGQIVWDSGACTIDQYRKFQASTRNKTLFQIFSSEIDYRRDDVLERLSTSNTKIAECLYVKALYNMYGSLTIQSSGYSKMVKDWSKLRFFGVLDDNWVSETHNTDGVTFHKDQTFRLSASDKQNIHWVFTYFDALTSSSESQGVKSVKDVKIPNWNDGYTNVQRDGSNVITDAIKKYQTFTTTINQSVYNNWISSAKYDLIPGKSSVPNQVSEWDAAREFLNSSDDLNKWLLHEYVPGNDENWMDEDADYIRNGFIGGGPSCFLMVTDNDFGTYDFPAASGGLYTSICNITHSPKTEDIESDEKTMYYGFGNYFKLEFKDGEYAAVNSNGDTIPMVLFDGDIYITPHEFTTMYKTYHFESPDTLQSTQITNYIPLESKVNTYFDYGNNLLNTANANLIYEPGQIDGIITQERPVHQYNMIYSDNDASNDVFTLISTDQNETNEFKQRAYFSEPKENGEFIDNYLIFKTASFIDVDSKYGQITNLLTDKNMLFYWQENAFGKFSVNERSLINDQNGNTIMLGQAGILSRYDYISTKYGMRLYDFCARSAEQGVYWVDINNKAVVAANNSQAVNYGETLGVQNIINDKISSNYPKIHYDLQNNELLCKCLDEEQQIIFNIRLNAPVSIYTRVYDDIIDIKNHLYGIDVKEDTGFSITKYNYLQYSDDIKYLTPMVLDFIINPSSSVTKVFDSQQIIPIKRSSYLPKSFNNTTMTFETDLYTSTRLNQKDAYTDREGNIIYNIPRFGNESYGNRLRGKWMKVEMKNENPGEYSTISHVITKFRQSFS